MWQPTNKLSTYSCTISSYLETQNVQCPQARGIEQKQQEGYMESVGRPKIFSHVASMPVHRNPFGIVRTVRRWHNK